MVHCKIAGQLEDLLFVTCFSYCIFLYDLKKTIFLGIYNYFNKEKLYHTISVCMYRANG